MRVYIILFFYCFFSIIGIAQTDIEAYGFRGKVKKVTYLIYPKKIEDLDNYQIKKIIYFNKKGNIDSIVELLFDKYITEKFITQFHYHNQKVTSSKKYRYGTTDLIEDMKFNWSENNLKCSFKSISVTSFSQGYRRLDKTHREISGAYSTKSKKGRILLDESYKNEIDSMTGELIKTEYENKEKGSYAILYSDKKRDEKGNIIEVSLTYADSKKIQRFIKKEFEYADD